MLPVCVLISLKGSPKLLFTVAASGFIRSQRGYCSLSLSIELTAKNNFLLSFEMIMDEVSLRAKEMSLLCLASFYSADYILP